MKQKNRTAYIPGQLLVFNPTYPHIRHGITISKTDNTWVEKGLCEIEAGTTVMFISAYIKSVLPVPGSGRIIVLLGDRFVSVVDDIFSPLKLTS